MFGPVLGGCRLVSEGPFHMDLTFVDTWSQWTRETRVQASVTPLRSSSCDPEEALSATQEPRWRAPNESLMSRSSAGWVDRTGMGHT